MKCRFGAEPAADIEYDFSDAATDRVLCTHGIGPKAINLTFFEGSCGSDPK